MLLHHDEKSGLQEKCIHDTHRVVSEWLSRLRLGTGAGRALLAAAAVELWKHGFGVSIRDANSGGPRGPPGPLGIAIP